HSSASGSKQSTSYPKTHCSTTRSSPTYLISQCSMRSCYVMAFDGPTKTFSEQALITRFGFINHSESTIGCFWIKKVQWHSEDARLRGATFGPRMAGWLHQLHRRPSRDPHTSRHDRRSRNLDLRHCIVARSDDVTRIRRRVVET